MIPPGSRGGPFICLRRTWTGCAGYLAGKPGRSAVPGSRRVWRGSEISVAMSGRYRRTFAGSGDGTQRRQTGICTWTCDIPATYLPSTSAWCLQRGADGPANVLSQLVSDVVVLRRTWQVECQAAAHVLGGIGIEAVTNLGRLASRSAIVSRRWSVSTRSRVLRASADRGVPGRRLAAGPARWPRSSPGAGSRAA